MGGGAGGAVQDGESKNHEPKTFAVILKAIGGIRSTLSCMAQ